MSTTLRTLAAAQDYPTKPVRIVVGFAAGGPTDVIARKDYERWARVIKAAGIKSE